MATGVTYEEFLEALTQLQEDQSLFEAEVGTELQGIHHEEIVKLGGQMCKRLRGFAKKGKKFAETLSPDFLAKIADTIYSYQNLIMPPKVLGGYCPCLKPARSGPEYEKKLMTVKAKMASIIFLSQAVIIDSQAEQHNLESMHFSEYVNKMTSIMNTLGDIKCAGNERALESARKKLLPCIVLIEKFLNNFEDDFADTTFKQDATRRLKSTQELLISRQQANGQGDGHNVPIPVSKRVLVKAQSSLQEIMNSGADISSRKAKDHLLALDKISSDLKKARDQEVAIFNQLEDGMHEINLMDMLHRLREDSEIVHSDANSKVRDALKRWSTVKSQSTHRKVAEYEEDFAPSQMNMPVMSVSIPPLPRNGPSMADLDPSKIPTKLLRTTTDTVGHLKAGLSNVVNEVNTGAKNVSKTIVTGLGAGGPPSPAPGKYTQQQQQHSAQSSSSSGKSHHPSPAAAPASTGRSGFSMFNPLEGLIDMPPANPPPPPPTQPQASTQRNGFSKFNPLDSIMDGIDSVTSGGGGGGGGGAKKSSTMGMFTLDAF